MPAPKPPRVRLSLGVTGHRQNHPAFAPTSPRVEATLAEIFNLITEATAAQKPPFGPGSIAPTRLHSMLADGFDQMAALQALDRSWELVCPLPFGERLNAAINASPDTAADARALLSGNQPADTVVAQRAAEINALCARAHVFALADDDPEVESVFLAALDNRDDRAKQDVFAADCSERVALAARLVIEQSDIIIALWDGVRTTFVGGTGHTIAAALELGAAVVWINPAAPEAWRVLRAPESLTCLDHAEPKDTRTATLKALVREALEPSAPTRAGHAPAVHHAGGVPLDTEKWHSRSSPLWHAYRRIEALFSGDKGRNPFRNLTQTYETPDQIATGSGAALLEAAANAPAGDKAFAAQLSQHVLGRFAWADGISARLSDTYRSGMMINFMLSSLAIVGGIAYLPLSDSSHKWAFALFELVLLCAILLITWAGQRRRWHGRWFETRRVAEYLRHAPLLLMLGAARAPGRWPKGAETSLPEWYARHALREAGLPRATITAPYLRHVLETLLDTHVREQRDYHHAKARRLTRVHHNLDQVSEWMFRLAVVSVALFLGLQVGAWMHWVSKGFLKEASYIFTFLGVLLPTFGGAIAGVRYFGDFERFAAISEVTAQKLDSIHARIALLMKAPDSAMDYGPVAELAHAADDVVVSEIENWQAVFGGKHITVPV